MAGRTPLSRGSGSTLSISHATPRQVKKGGRRIDMSPTTIWGGHGGVSRAWLRLVALAIQEPQEFLTGVFSQRRPQHRQVA